MLGPWRQKEARGRRTRKGAGAMDGKHQPAPAPGPLPFHTHSFRGFEAARSRFTRARLEGGRGPSHAPPSLSFPLAAWVSFLSSKHVASPLLKPLSFLSWNLPRERHLCFCFNFCSAAVFPGKVRVETGPVGSWAASGSTRRGSWCLRGPGPSVSRP